jgi:hypothetical protein
MEMSTRNLRGGKGQLVHKADIVYMCRSILNIILFSVIVNVFINAFYFYPSGMETSYPQRQY